MRRELTFTTNHRPRPILPWQDLSPAEKTMLDSLRPAVESSTLVRYQGQLYDLTEAEVFTRRVPMEDDWDGFWPVAEHEAVVIRISKDRKWVVVGMAKG